MREICATAPAETFSGIVLYITDVVAYTYLLLDSMHKSGVCCIDATESAVN
jgi:hypothetical protein